MGGMTQTLPKGVSRGPQSPRRAVSPRASRRTSNRGLRLESLEQRHLLSIEAVLTTVDEATYPGRIAHSLARVSNLSSYTSEQLDAADQWVVVNPALVGVTGSHIGGISSTSPAASTMPMSSTSTTSPTFRNWPFTPPASVAGVKTLTDQTTDMFVWSFPTDMPWQQVAADLRTAAGDGYFYPLVPHTVSKKLIPNDPYFAQQWHLRNTGQSLGTVGEDINVTSAWDTVRGTNVLVGVVDDGIQYTHPDLAANYRSDIDIDVLDGDVDPSPVLANEDYHGTSVAGIIAAVGGNSLGISGVAPAAKIAGIRLLDADQTDAQEALALGHRRDLIAIYNNSWGPVDGVDWLDLPGPATLDAIRDSALLGRGGRGSIFTWAAGNGLEDDDDTNYDGYANYPYVIAVAAVDPRGRQASYSEPGAAILVSAPGGQGGGDLTKILSTDLVGAEGYNYVAGLSDDDAFPDLNYTGDFYGTSAATPVVSGVVALMLEANPNLTWRDVQHILVNTARQNHRSDPGWSVNGAGFHINHKYGFGVVDAAAAVNLARNWQPVAARTITVTDPFIEGRTIPDNNTTGISSTVTVSGTNIGVLEHIEVVLTTNHTYGGDLRVVLTSPSGTTSVLAEQHDDSTNYDNWTFMSTRHWGETVLGNWTLRISDEAGQDVGTWVDWRMVFYTSPAPPPTAVNDLAVTLTNMPVVINVLANDAGRINATTVVVTTPPTNGTVAVNATTGAITYTPNPGFHANDTFRYVVSSVGGVQSNIATVTVAVNDPPQLFNDTFSIGEDNVGTFVVLANDVDADGTITPSSVTVSSQPQHGSVTVDITGRIIYTPVENYFGSDTFTYTARDDDNTPGAAATVNVTITSVNDAPIARNDELRAIAGAETQLAILTNDQDIDGELIRSSVEILTYPTIGTAVVDPATGVILYDTPPTFLGNEQLTYRVRDNSGDWSNVATLFIGRSTAPSALDDTLTVIEDVVTNLAVLVNDFDFDGYLSSSSIVIVSPPTHGHANVNSTLR